MFATFNIDFGFALQSNSMFVPINIESSFAVKPNYGFRFVKRDFGWAEPGPPRPPHGAGGV